MSNGAGPDLVFEGPKYRGIARVRYDGTTNTVRGYVEIQTRGGARLWLGRLTVPLAALEQEIRQQLTNRERDRIAKVSGSPEEIAGVLSRISEVTKTIARRTGVKRLARGVAKVVTLAPGLAKIYPPLDVTYAQLKGAAKLVTQARRGNPVARQRVRAISSAAKAGDPTAKHGMTTIAALNTFAAKGEDLEAFAEEKAADAASEGAPVFLDDIEPGAELESADDSAEVSGWFLADAQGR